MTDTLKKAAAEMERDFRKLLISLKPDIGDDYRASSDPEETLPGMQVTIGTNADLSEWSYQTGDNSYTGGAYGFPYWGIIHLYRRSNCTELAADAIDQICDQIVY